MEKQVKNPLVIRCEYCGGDQSYDLVKQKYVCSHCGAEANGAEKKAEYLRWRSLRKSIVMSDMTDVKTFACPSCGAQTMAKGDDASAQCPFCQNTMIDASFAGTDLPEVILPFKLNKQEALDKLKGWIDSNKSNPAAKALEKNLHRFSGCYLPYHIVRGGYESVMAIRMQDGTEARYPFRAYLSHTAVNASKDWDNLFLDGIEPFDFEEAREFDFGFLNHQNAKIPNVVNETLNARIKSETSAELYDALSRKVGTKELTVYLNNDDNESIPALMPVYLVKCKNGIAAAVNGQTGKVSIATGKEKNLTGRWWLWPLLATLAVIIAGAVIGILTGQGLAAGIEIGALSALVFGLVFFAIAHNRHSKEVVKEVITLPKEKEGHNDTQTEFFADFGKGPAPAVIKFFTPRRIVLFVLVLLAVIFLPVLVAIPIQLLRGMPISDIQIGYGAAWYCIPGFMAIVFAGGLAKAMMYGSPIYYEIQPNGKLTRRKTVHQQKHSWRQAVPGLRKASAEGDGMSKRTIGCAVAIVLFLLIGSVAAMLS